MWPTGSVRNRGIAVAALLLLPLQLFAQDNILDREIRLPGNSIRVSKALSEVSRLTGYLFTYDSRIISSDRSFSLPSYDMPLRELLDSVSNDPDVKVSVIGKHIILYREAAVTPDTGQAYDATPAEIFISGRVTDAESAEPLPYATIGISHHGRGTVTNFNGDFILRLNSQFLEDTLSVSYVGYVNRLLPVRSLTGNILTISMERDYIPIPEIIIRAQDPRLIIRKTISSVASNYGTTPALLTGFYREGVYRKKEPQVYSEAVVQIYKSPYARSLQNDQIKVLRSRKIENLEVKDTLAVRLKAGLSATLTLDGMRNLFDFLDPASFNSYDYHLTDIVTIDDQSAFVISFCQREDVTEPLMQGDIYINVESYAVMLADFEINPLYIDRTATSYVSRLPRSYSMKPEYVRYRTRYRYVDGRYFLSHVRGDLGFMARGRKKLFSSRFNIFFELAVTDHRTTGVVRFDHDELAPAYSVFSNTITGYDAGFWKGFDFLKPEEDLVEALQRLQIRLGEFAGQDSPQ
ncbi:MAG: carboxypeptidase-like regulatory domain-containing protein [Bacteroidales bacterium]|nr:carboxypeptidase-like regulatory domain-containing protein [Bacteroidales bacterium]MDT8373346.1 carboxypeptidase-like regulatory domain-containing protein [Bacteroidales bacterium]